MVAGGVASNTYIRGRLSLVAQEAGLQLVCPPPRLCTDNGVMVAWAGVERMQLGLIEPPPASGEPADGEWVDLRPRWPLTDRKDPRSYLAPRSAKKKRVFTSLTALMQQAQEEKAEAAEGKAEAAEGTAGMLEGRAEEQPSEQTVGGIA